MDQSSQAKSHSGREGSWEGYRNEILMLVMFHEREYVPLRHEVYTATNRQIGKGQMAGKFERSSTLKNGKAPYLPRYFGIAYENCLNFLSVDWMWREGV